MSDPRPVITAYYDAWRAKDTARLRDLLADDVEFVGPLGRASGKDECARGLEGLVRMTTELRVEKLMTDGDEAMTWFELTTTAGGPMQVVNWSRVEGGKLVRMRATFDPRPMLK